MTQKFPPKPWNVDDTFTNDETGVIYVYTGEQWIASGGPEVEGVYLPLVGGKLSEPGNLNVEGQFKVSTGSELKVEYDDGTNMVRVRPDNDEIVLRNGVINTKNTLGSLGDRSGLEIQVSGEKPLAISNSGSYQSTFEIYGYDGDAPGGRARNLWIGAQGNINTDGNVNSQSFVKGSELRSTKLTSGQSSNLQIYRGSGDSEERKMLIGTDSVNLDVSLKLVGGQHKDIQVQNGTKINTGADEIITFGGSGAFYRGVINNNDHIVNKAYVDGEITDLDDKYVKTEGSSTIEQGALRIIPRDVATKALVVWEGDPENGEEKCFIDRSGHLNTTATTFSDQDCVTKKYVDDAVDLASRGRVRLGEFVLRSTTGQPTGNAQAGELTLWHTTEGSSTTPANEFKLRPTADAEYTSLDIYNLLQDLFENSQIQVVLVQGDQEMHLLGKDRGWLTDSNRTFHLSAESYYGDELFVGNTVELFADAKVSESLDDFYLKTGGDIHGFVRVVKDSGVVLGTRPNDLADNLFQVWADGVVEMKNYLQFDGSTREIKSGSTTMFDFSGNNVRIPRRNDNNIGFQLKGKAYTQDENLLNVYHRPDYDEIMYRGKIDDPYAIVTKSWVEANAGGINPGDQVAKTDGSTSVQTGGFYISGGSLYVKIS